MLFKQELLEDIKSGNVSLVYRRWKKPLVKGGKLLKTAIGIIGIAEIHQIDDNEISHDDAAHAGYNDVQTLLASVNNGNTGNLYKISVYFHSEDPRIELRNNDSLNENDIEEITAALERMDRYSTLGKWTFQMLNIINENPKLSAGDISELLNDDKDRLKMNIRKLKDIGLTISHEVGYSLSPRGKAYFEEYLKRKDTKLNG